LASLDQYPRPYLIQLSLSIGIYPTMPAPVNYWLTSWWTPTWFLRRYIRNVAAALALDDQILLYEEEVFRSSSRKGCQNTTSFVQTLTNVELMDACLLRGLPIIHVSREEMCRSLTNHLHMIASILRTKQNPTRCNDHTFQSDNAQAVFPIVTDETIGLFGLHLPILRTFLKMNATSL
jgi:hypothetical protein